METAVRDDHDCDVKMGPHCLSHRICTGIPRRRLGKLIAELADPWTAQQESRLRERRGGDRVRAPGAHDLDLSARPLNQGTT
ncbi:hypothetical protein ACFY2R_10480 [Micromonospora olivasterospora]|uniref:hypothetical protein n=1 Tax=Micromonospora olivasterospora TaxID=1880 RepID=UPI0011A5ABC0|nr:hypothetical protein [Micromonospora olivasterospora]